MQAGRWFVQIPVLNDLKYRFNVESFTNVMSSLSGVLKLKIFASSLDDFLKIQQKLKIDEEVNASFGNENYNSVIMKGIIEDLSYSCSNLKYDFKIGVVFQTFRFQQIKTKPYDTYTNYSDKTSREAIKKLFKVNGCDKLYEDIKFPLKMKEKEGKQIDMKIYSNNKSIFEILEMFVNDLQVRIFTTIIKNKTTLYFYDTGEFLDLSKQEIRNDNFLDFRFNVRGSKIFDKISVQFLKPVSDSNIDYKTLGVPAEMKKNANANNTSNTIKTEYSYLKSKRLNLPDIIFTRTLKTTSSQGDLNDYKDYLIKSSLDDGLVIEVIVNSLYIDIKKPERGTWELGSRIRIDADILRKVLSINFAKYLKENDKYFFILKGIDFINGEKGTETKLYISLSDLHRIG